MKKTLYIQIDNNSLPDGCGEDVEVLDCRCINDFCSMVGDALVGDLKDEKGKPFYRLINPVGRLLMEFKSAYEEAFNGIISKWYDYLGELLNKGALDSDMTIKFPQTYIDWLLQNDNPYYESVGRELQKKKGVIVIPTEEVIDDITASLVYKTSHFLQEKKDDISFVVFNNPIIRNSSFVVKRVKFDGMEFLRYDNWSEIIKKKKKDINYSTTSTSRVPAKRKQTDKEFSANGVSFKMIHVEGGTFMMGATPEQGYDAHSDEKPAHQVTLDNFYIGQCEVTQELWKAVMGEIPLAMHNLPFSWKATNNPVVKVCWDDPAHPEYSCQEFIRNLNKLTGMKFRLPTEAEWEYAARGGNRSKGCKYAGSDNIDKVAWYSGNSGSQIHPVAHKQPNELEIYDMSGNVREWCQDWKGDYLGNNQTNPKGPMRGSCRVTRGGSWLSGSYPSNQTDCRISCRYESFEPSFRNGDLGFRLAL